MRHRSVYVPEISSPSEPRLRVGGGIAGAAALCADFVYFGFGSKAFVAAFVSVVLVTLAVKDLESRRIPNVVVLPAAEVVLVARIALRHGDWWEWPVAGVGAAAILFVAALLSRGGVGMGDVKLALFLGFALGSATTAGLLIGFAGAALYSCVLLVTRGRSALRAAFPLAPFLAVGGCVAVLLT